MKTLQDSKLLSLQVQEGESSIINVLYGDHVLIGFSADTDFITLSTPLSELMDILVESAEGVTWSMVNSHIDFSVGVQHLVMFKAAIEHIKILTEEKVH